jgi:uncharacterized membrane protein YcaP (DUF421 family)
VKEAYIEGDGRISIIKKQPEDTPSKPQEKALH